MSALTAFRDYALKQAGLSGTSTPDAALWLQLAAEVDEYLHRDIETDLFGEQTAEPTPPNPAAAESETAAAVGMEG